MTSPPLIKMHGITKRFGNVIANDEANFTLQHGEIHAIVGENGAGKSTLMKILYGLYRPNEGQIYYRGEPVYINNPRAAIQLGIGMVQQHFTLIPALTALENIVLAKRTNSLQCPARYHNSAPCHHNARRTTWLPSRPTCEGGIASNWRTTVCGNPQSPLPRCRNPNP